MSPQARRSSFLPWYLHLRCQAVELWHDRGCWGTGRAEAQAELGHRPGQQELLLAAQGLREADFSDDPWDLLFSVLLLTVLGCLRVSAHNGNPTRELWEFLCSSSFSNFPELPPPPLCAPPSHSAHPWLCRSAPPSWVLSAQPSGDPKPPGQRRGDEERISISFRSAA